MLGDQRNCWERMHSLDSHMVGRGKFKFSIHENRFMKQLLLIASSVYSQENKAKKPLIFVEVINNIIHNCIFISLYFIAYKSKPY